MLKKDILDLINNFEMETWKYNNHSEKLNDDMQYIYSIEKGIKNVDEGNLKQIYDRLLLLIGIIRFKYGFENIIVNTNSELVNIKKIIDDISLDGDDIINQYNYILTVYNNFMSENRNMDFIRNKYKDIQGKEGLFLAIESLKSLITNGTYRNLLNDQQINDIIVDCIKLNNGIVDIKKVELKYKEIIKQVWAYSISNTIDDNKKFRVLFSNINGGNLRETAKLLVNRPSQSSCSLISSDFIATYGSRTRKTGLIYSNDSEIIMTSAYDLGSNVFESGLVNKEKGTSLATPEVIEKIGILRAKEKNEDLHSSSCYNEVLVNSKPCGIVVLGLGENDLNIDYQEVKMLSLEMQLPIYYVDTMQYKNSLSDEDKNYIAFHSILSYLGISANDLLQIGNDNTEIYDLIINYREKISEIFLILKKNGNLNKENMCQILHNILDVSKKNEKSK